MGLDGIMEVEVILRTEIVLWSDKCMFHYVCRYK